MNNKESIYELIIKNLPITDFTLKELGFEEAEVKKLIDEGFLILNNNEYNLFNIEYLYQYGLNLTLNGNFRKANLCFEKCFELEPNNREYMLRVLAESIRLANYEKIISFIPLLESDKSEKATKENNMFLYLLSLATFIPKNYHLKVRNFDYDDLIYSYDCEIENKQKENEIRSLIVKSSYKYALTKINDYIAKQNCTKSHIIVLKELLKNVIELEDKFKYELLTFAKKKEYDKIVRYLETKTKKRYLKSNEVYIQMISKALLELLETRNIPPVTVDDTIYMYDALNGNNYELAKTLNYFYKKANNQNSIEDNIIKILLTDIIDLIEQIKLDNERPTLTKTIN